MNDQAQVTEEGMVEQYRVIIIIGSGGDVSINELTFPSSKSAHEFRNSVGRNFSGYGYVSRIFKETLKFGIRFKYEEIE